MPKLLHILTSPCDEWTARIIQLQREQSENQVTVVDLTVSEPDYAALVTLVLEADSVATW